MPRTASITVYCINYPKQRYHILFREEEKNLWNAYRIEKLEPLTDAQKKILYERANGIEHTPTTSEKLSTLFFGKKRNEFVEESSSVQMQGSFKGDTTCPFCGNDNYVKCGTCGRLTCYETSTGKFICAACGIHGTITGTIHDLDGSGC